MQQYFAVHDLSPIQCLPCYEHCDIPIGKYRGVLGLSSLAGPAISLCQSRPLLPVPRAASTSPALSLGLTPTRSSLTHFRSHSHSFTLTHSLPLVHSHSFALTHSLSVLLILTHPVRRCIRHTYSTPRKQPSSCQTPKAIPP
jgi:hypothetical protein